MRVYIFFILAVIAGCTANLSKIQMNKEIQTDIKKQNYETSVKNLKDDKYCDSIGLTKLMEVSAEDSIINTHKYRTLVKKYINKLPHKDIQIEKAVKYDIPIDLVILWNFQESDFTNVTHNGKLNGDDKPKDWGALQVNASGKNKVVKKYILNKKYDKYYDLAFNFMSVKKSKYKKTWFTNWNSRNKDTADKYYKDFLKRTNKKSRRDLRKLI